MMSKKQQKLATNHVHVFYSRKEKVQNTI